MTGPPEVRYIAEESQLKLVYIDYQWSSALLEAHRWNIAQARDGLSLVAEIMQRGRLVLFPSEAVTFNAKCIIRDLRQLQGPDRTLSLTILKEFTAKYKGEFFSRQLCTFEAFKLLEASHWKRDSDVVLTRARDLLFPAFTWDTAIDDLR